MCVRTGVRGGSPAKKILTRIRRKTAFPGDDFWVVSSARSAKFRLQPAASRVSAQYKMLLSYSSRAAACLHAASATRLLCCCRAFCGLLAASAYSKLTSCASSCRRMLWLLTPTVLRHRHRTYFCVLRSSMLSTAAERRLMVTPISCLEGRKCSFLLCLLLLLCWCHKQSCSAPRDMSIGTLSSV